MLRDAMPPSPALGTERLHLREPVVADAPLLLAYYVRNEPRFARWEPPLWEQVERYVRWVRWRTAESVARRGLSFLAFDREQPDALVGVVNALRHRARPRRTRRCWATTSTARTRAGATRAKRSRRRSPTCSRRSTSRSVTANYDPRNERSGALLRRLGFVVDGYARDHLYLRGSWRDAVLTSLTNPDWIPPD